MVKGKRNGRERNGKERERERDRRDTYSLSFLFSFFFTFLKEFHSSLLMKILNEKRFFAEYYRVGYYGKGKKNKQTKGAREREREREIMENFFPFLSLFLFQLFFLVFITIGFDKSLRNKAFIYRGLELEMRPEFVERVTKLFPQAEVLSYTEGLTLLTLF
jgi:hypothetical protein